MSSENKPKLDTAQLLELLKKAEQEAAKLEVGGQLGQGTIQTFGLILNGIFNLIGKWIEASGRVYSSKEPLEIVGWTAANVYVLRWFLTTDPWKTIIKILGFTSLLKGLALQFGRDIPPPPTAPTAPHQPVTVDSFGNVQAPQQGYPYGVLFNYVNIFDSTKSLNGAEYFTTAADRDAWITQQGSRIDVTKLINP